MASEKATIGGCCSCGCILLIFGAVLLWGLAGLLFVGGVG